MTALDLDAVASELDFAEAREEYIPPAIGRALLQDVGRLRHRVGECGCSVEGPCWWLREITRVKRA